MIIFIIMKNISDINRSIIKAYINSIYGSLLLLLEMKKIASGQNMTTLIHIEKNSNTKIMRTF